MPTPGTTPGTTPRTSGHGVVLGGGVAGLLAAAVLAGRMETVTVVERDRFGGPGRAGVPQAHHAHLLLGRGAAAIEEIVPSTIPALLAAGARRLAMPQDVLTFTPHGWLPRFHHDLFLISCTRTLLETTLRERVLGRVDVRDGHEVVGLTGGRDGITGVRLLERGNLVHETMPADLVVDATGARSRAGQWLTELGVPAPRETVVDAGIRYATRIHRPPAGWAAALPAVCVQPSPATGEAHGGVVLPVEGDRWVISLTGMRGHEPPTDDAGFAAFARGLRHPLVAELLDAAAPEGPVRGYAAPPNRHRRLPPVPGFLAIGDAVCTFNPVYGHGMTVAALAALALRDGGGQPRIDRVTRDAWALATGMDVRHDATVAPAGPAPGGLRAAFGDLVGAAAVADPKVAGPLLDAYTLSTPMSRLLRPRKVIDVLRARRSHRPDVRPPISEREAALIRAGGGER